MYTIEQGYTDCLIHGPHNPTKIFRFFLGPGKKSSFFGPGTRSRFLTDWFWSVDPWHWYANDMKKRTDHYQLFNLFCYQTNFEDFSILKFLGNKIFSTVENTWSVVRTITWRKSRDQLDGHRKEDRLTWLAVQCIFRGLKRIETIADHIKVERFGFEISLKLLPIGWRFWWMV